MQLKHINFATSDVAGLGAFFERYFAFKRLLECGSGAFMLMSNDEEFVLTLMKTKKQDPAIYPETFHIGFYVGDPAAVQAKHDELAAAGCSPDKTRRRQRTRYTLLLHRTRQCRCRNRDDAGAPRR